ncbi:MAG: hypothetical protein OXE77_08175, partial [Flavobacteriaceae bacterium]|nr:hypothetical protein [Flavobacteriaceae bacterium]MCY4267080.1 hypothetical protein [Flavobacteriaceae bacterium]
QGIQDGLVNEISHAVRSEIIHMVNFIQKDAGLNLKQIARKHKSKSLPTLERYLMISRKLNIIEFKGAPKSGGYYLTDKTNRLIS